MSNAITIPCHSGIQSMEHKVYKQLWRLSGYDDDEDLYTEGIYPYEDWVARGKVKAEFDLIDSSFEGLIYLPHLNRFSYWNDDECFGGKMCGDIEVDEVNKVVRLKRLYSLFQADDDYDDVFWHNIDAAEALAEAIGDGLVVPKEVEMKLLRPMFGLDWTLITEGCVRAHNKICFCCHEGIDYYGIRSRAIKENHTYDESRFKYRKVRVHGTFDNTEKIALSRTVSHKVYPQLWPCFDFQGLRTEGIYPYEDWIARGKVQATFCFMTLGFYVEYIPHHGKFMMEDPYHDSPRIIYGHIEVDATTKTVNLKRLYRYLPKYGYNDYFDRTETLNWMDVVGVIADKCIHRCLLRPMFGLEWNINTTECREVTDFSPQTDFHDYKVHGYTIPKEDYAYAASCMCKYGRQVKGYFDNNTAATTIQAAYRGWKIRMKYRFNPFTRLGKWLELKEFDAICAV